MRRLPVLAARSERRTEVGVVDERAGWPVSWGKPAPKPKATGKIQKCPTCKKSLLACPGHTRGKGTPVKEKVKVEDKNGRPRTVTRNTGQTERGGITWCSCSCRVINGRCTNATCSTNRGTS